MVAPVRLGNGEPTRRAFAFWGVGRAKARPAPAPTDAALPFEIAPRLWAYVYDEDRMAWRDSAHRHVLSSRCVARIIRW